MKKLSADAERKLCLQCKLPDCLPNSRSCLIRIETGTFPRGARMADPAVRAKMSAASKRALADPAVRAKISAASKRAWAEKKKAA